MRILQIALMVVALLCFLLGAFRVKVKVTATLVLDLTPLGLFFWLLAVLLGFVRI